MSVMLTLVLALQMTAPAVYATNVSSQNFSILLEEIDEAAGKEQQAADLLFF